MWGKKCRKTIQTRFKKMLTEIIGDVDGKASRGNGPAQWSKPSLITETKISQVKCKKQTSRNSLHTSQ